MSIYQVTRKVRMSNDRRFKVALIVHKTDQGCIDCGRTIPAGEECLNLGDPAEGIAASCLDCVPVERRMP